MADNPNCLGIDSVEIKAPLETRGKLISAGYSIVSENDTIFEVSDPDGARIKITSMK